jgi:hypothetical protein
MPEGVTLTQADVSTVILPMIDRMIIPVIARLDKTDEKLDRAIAIGERVHAVELENTRLARDLDRHISDTDKQKTAVGVELEAMKMVGAANKARSGLTNIFLTVICAPVMIALILAGIASLFHIHLPGGL